MLFIIHRSNDILYLKLEKDGFTSSYTVRAELQPVMQIPTGPFAHYLIREERGVDTGSLMLVVHK